MKVNTINTSTNYLNYISNTMIVSCLMFRMFALNKNEILEFKQYKQNKLEIMKNTVKQVTAGAFLAILLLIGNTNGSASEFENLRPTIEPTLIAENWMIDETIWNKTSNMNYEIIQASETSLELENWMTSESTWNLTEIMIEETEKQLTVEDWMIKDNIWNRE